MNPEKWLQARHAPGVAGIPPDSTTKSDDKVRSEKHHLSERIGLKNKNATDSTDSTDVKSLADDAFELERPGAEIEEQR
jgi:hypothetical protein